MMMHMHIIKSKIAQHVIATNTQYKNTTNWSIPRDKSTNLAALHWIRSELDTVAPHKNLKVLKIGVRACAQEGGQALRERLATSNIHSFFPLDEGFPCSKGGGLDIEIHHLMEKTMEPKSGWNFFHVVRAVAKHVVR